MTIMQTLIILTSFAFLAGVTVVWAFVRNIIRRDQENALRYDCASNVHRITP